MGNDISLDPSEDTRAKSISEDAVSAGSLVGNGNGGEKF